MNVTSLLRHVKYLTVSLAYLNGFALKIFNGWHESCDFHVDGNYSGDFMETT